MAGSTTPHPSLRAIAAAIGRGGGGGESWPDLPRPRSRREEGTTRFPTAYPEAAATGWGHAGREKVGAAWGRTAGEGEWD